MNHPELTPPNEMPPPAPVKRRRGAAIGLAGGLLAGTAAGLVIGVPGITSAGSDPAEQVASLVQQTDESDSTPVEPDAPAARGERLREALQDLVDAGTITAEQADAVADHLVGQLPERGVGNERRGPGGRAILRHGAGVASEALTDLLGLEAQELRVQLRDGSTLAEIATAQGVDPQAVVDELVGEYQERLDNAVENGRIDQADADDKLADATDRITDLVNNGRPERGPADADAPVTED